MPVIQKSTYKPPFYLFNGHFQTIFPAIFRKVKGIKYDREKIETKDKDFLDLDWSIVGSKKLAIISHGLEGDSHRPYVKGLAKALNKNGYDVMAWNFRGCGGEMNRTLKFYHSGATEDLDHIVLHALKNRKYEEITLTGFSLGGNLTLKYLGECGSNLHPEIKKSVVFSVPLNLYTSCLQISKPANFIYSSRFLKKLKKKVRSKSLLLPDLINTKDFKKIKNLKDFDDHYTAPLHGFKDALAYYESCSAINFLNSITIPTLIVNAKNDPFLSNDCYPDSLLIDHPCVYFEAPEQGGHCGFAQKNSQGYYWSELRALKFLQS
jgi:predicted alpha/beta-fold hydrolase